MGIIVIKLYLSVSLSLSDVSDAIINEAVMCIASQYAVTSGSEDKALILYDQLSTYQAAYNTSQVKEDTTIGLGYSLNISLYRYTLAYLKEMNQF